MRRASVAQTPRHERRRTLVRAPCRPARIAALSRLRRRRGRLIAADRARSTPASPAVLWIDDPRPFWHPLVTGADLRLLDRLLRQRRAAPWEKRIADRRGSRSRGRDRRADRRGPGDPASRATLSIVRASSSGDVSSRCNVVRRVRQRPAHRACSSTSSSARRAPRRRCTRPKPSGTCCRSRRSRRSLKLMQAQVEPHFLFNTLAVGAVS